MNGDGAFDPSKRNTFNKTSDVATGAMVGGRPKSSKKVYTIVPSQTQLEDASKNSVVTLDDITSTIKAIASHLQQETTTEDEQVNLWNRWAKCQTELYDDESTTTRIQFAFAVTDPYLKQKLAVAERFFRILQTHPMRNVRALADVVKHKETGEATYRLINLCGGTKTQSKKLMMNTCLVIFGINCTMISKTTDKFFDRTKLPPAEVAAIQYAPSTLSLMHKQLFAWFKDNGVYFASKDFKGMEGSFHAAIQQKFDDTVEHRPTYGRRKSAPVDPMAQHKIRDPTNGLTPYSMSMEPNDEKGYNDLSRMLLHELGCTFGPRGRKEPSSLYVSSFEFFVEEEIPKYVGRRCLVLMSFGNADKTNKISLANPYVLDTSGSLKIWENPADPYCIVKLFDCMVNKHVIPAMTYHGLTDAPLFNRRASAKELKVSTPASSFNPVHSLAIF
jgi:hypothetical protein